MALASWTKLRVEYNRDKKNLRKKAVVRAAAILTNSYVATDEVDITGFSRVGIFFALLAGSLTSFEYKVQQSVDGGDTWHDITAETVTLTTITDGQPYYTIAATDQNSFKGVYAWGERLRLQVKGTGTLTSSSLAVTLVGVY